MLVFASQILLYLTLPKMEAGICVVGIRPVPSSEAYPPAMPLLAKFSGVKPSTSCLAFQVAAEVIKASSIALPFQVPVVTVPSVIISVPPIKPVKSTSARACPGSGVAAFIIVTNEKIIARRRIPEKTRFLFVPFLSLTIVCFFIFFKLRRLFIDIYIINILLPVVNKIMNNQNQY